MKSLRSFYSALLVVIGSIHVSFSFDDDIQVLWIGNSYTYVNDVPKTTQGLSYNDGIPHHIEYDQHTEGGWTWEDHADSKETLDKIASRKWDVVVLQEQSQRPAFDEDRVCRNTVEPLNTLVEKIKESNPNAKIQFYDTWGRPFGDDKNCEKYPQFCTYESMQDSLTTAYSTFACMNLPSRLAPVGEGFRKMEQEYGLDARLSLYNTNGESDHHASPKGSYLSACLHYLALFGSTNTSATVIGNDEHGGLNKDDALLIQELAVDVWNKGNGWQYPDDSDCSLHIC